MIESSMVARAEELTDALRSKDYEAKLKALRAVKNQIIGNKSKKLSFIGAGAVPRVLELLASETDSNILIQSAATLGSFAYGTNVGINEIIRHNGLSHLVKILESKDSKVVEAAVRSLKLVYQTGSAPCDAILSPAVLPCLISLLSGPNAELAETAALVLAKCNSTTSQQQLLTNAGALDGYTSLLMSKRKSSQTAALEGLSSLINDNIEACRRLAMQPAVLDALLQLLKERSPTTRFMAATCLTHLSRVDISSSGSSSSSTSSTSSSDHESSSVQDQMHRARSATLPVLLRLLSDSMVSELVPPILAKLLEDSEELQKSAVDADAVRILANFLAQPSSNGTASSAGSLPSTSSSTSSSSSSSALKEGVLRSLGSLCMNRDEGRKQLIEAKVLKQIVRALEDSCDRVRAAAALCIMGLTRSVKNLRSNLLEADVAEALCRLLSDSNPDVQVNAAAAICNLVLEFSSIKDAVLKQGGLQCLTQLTSSMVPPLRLHSCWALRNLAYKSETSVRHSLMQALPWSSMRALLNDPDEAVQEQAICTLRNLCMDSAEHITAAFEWAGSDLLAVLEEKLDPTRSGSLPIMMHALYTVVNLLTGNELHKEAVMSSNLPALLLHHLRHPGSMDVRLPAVWCIINLTWPDSLPSVIARVKRLRDMGMEDALRNLQHDASFDIRERVKTALEQLR